MAPPLIDPDMPFTHASKKPMPLTGTFVDTIAEVSDELSRTTELAALTTLLAVAYNVRTPDPSREDTLNVLMRTMSGDRLGSATTPDFPSGFSRDEVLLSFRRFLSPVLDGLTGLVEFEERVNAGGDPASFRRFWSVGEGNLLSDAATASALATTPPRYLSDPPHRLAQVEAVPFLDVFVADGGRGKRIALTRERGLLAIVPASVEVGDEVWTASHSELPIFLRHGTSEGLEDHVLGEGYVHGLCDTERAPGSNARYHKDVDLPMSSVAVGLAGTIPR